MPTNTNSSDTFRIYVASLSDYNAGILHGTWIDFAQLTDLDDLRAAIAAMLATSPTAKAAPGQPAEKKPGQPTQKPAYRNNNRFSRKK